MSQHHAMIVGSNGFSYSVANECAFGKRLKEYKDDYKKISCVAVGPSNYFAVVTSEGAAWYCGPANFKEKMGDIKCSEIKQISFGPEDQWVIVMKSGWCHASLWSTKTDCLKTLNEHNGKVAYVSLCENASDWIVGYGRNGYVAGGGLCDKLTSFLDGLNSARDIIHLVEVGRDNRYFVQHGEGKNAFKWSLESTPSDFFEETEHPFTSLSLW